MKYFLLFLLVLVTQGCATHQQSTNQPYTLVDEWYEWPNNRDWFWPTPPRVCKYTSGTIVYVGQEQCPLRSAL